MLMVQNVLCMSLFPSEEGDNGRGVKRNGNAKKWFGSNVQNARIEVRSKDMCCDVEAIEHVSCSVCW